MMDSHSDSVSYLYRCVLLECCSSLSSDVVNVIASFLEYPSVCAGFSYWIVNISYVEKRTQGHRFEKPYLFVDYDNAVTFLRRRLFEWAKRVILDRELPESMLNQLLKLRRRKDLYGLKELVEEVGQHRKVGHRIEFSLFHESCQDHDMVESSSSSSDSEQDEGD